MTNCESGCSSAALLLMMVLMTSYCQLAIADKPTEAEIRQAIAYVRERVNAPSDSDNGSSNAQDWSSRLLRAVAAMQSHPVYHRWALEDQLARESRQRFGSPKSESTSFDCRLDRSPVKPSSVHKLRPADIDVIAGMGDSLTAGSGARATGIVGLLIEYRGYAWSIGGETTLDNHVTLPNILRNSNSKLHGYSIGNGNVIAPNSRLNVAEPGKVAADMPRQAQSLVRKLKLDPNVDFENDWKMITLFIGGNDVCDYCQDKDKLSPANFINHIKSALDHLHENVPRAFVNVVEVLDVSMVKELKDGSETCAVLLGSMLCKCPAYPESPEQEQEIIDLQLDYQRLLRELVDSGRYDTREDFTVVNQPFLRDSGPPRIDGKIDFDFFAPDCFHFGVRGHSSAAKGLWNNMLEPVGKKSSQWNPEGDFMCPTEERPYLMTSKNS